MDLIVYIKGENNKILIYKIEIFDVVACFILSLIKYQLVVFHDFPFLYIFIIFYIYYIIYIAINNQQFNKQFLSFFIYICMYYYLILTIEMTHV